MPLGQEGRSKQQEEEVLGLKTRQNIRILSIFLSEAHELLPEAFNEEEEREVERDQERAKASAEKKGLPPFPLRETKFMVTRVGHWKADDSQKNFSFRKNVAKVATDLATWSLTSSLDFSPTTRVLMEVCNCYDKASQTKLIELHLAGSKPTSLNQRISYFLKRMSPTIVDALDLKNKHSRSFWGSHVLDFS